MTDNRLEAVLRDIATHLDDSGRRWALVGGLAVSVRTEPRFTRDIDVAVSVESDEDAESLVDELRRSGYGIVASVEQEAVGRLATTRLTPPGTSSEGVVLDLLFASSGIEGEIAEAAEVVEAMPGVRVPVARTGHLLILKLLARDERRPQDWPDVTALAAALGPEELERARVGCRLVAERGYARGRDLAAELEATLGPV